MTKYLMCCWEVIETDTEPEAKLLFSEVTNTAINSDLEYDILRTRSKEPIGLFVAGKSKNGNDINLTLQANEDKTQFTIGEVNQGYEFDNLQPPNNLAKAVSGDLLTTASLDSFYKLTISEENENHSNAGDRWVTTDSFVVNSVEEPLNLSQYNLVIKGDLKQPQLVAVVIF